MIFTRRSRRSLTTCLLSTRYLLSPHARTALGFPSIMPDGSPSKRQRVGNAAAASDIELLSAWFCPYAQRAWMALEEKCPGSYKLTEAMKVIPPDDRYEKIPELLDSNPNGLVPVIIDRRRRRATGGDDRAGRGSSTGGVGDNVGDNGNDTREDGPPTIVYESLICVEYADEALGTDEGPSLLGGSPARRAESRMWADYCNKNFCSPFYHLLMKKTDEERAGAKEKMLRTLRAFGERCVGPFFFGEDFSLVDVALAPWAVGIRMDVLGHYRGFAVPTTLEYAKYRTWAEAVSQRPSFKATACDDLQAMIRVYRRYADGTALSKVGDAVRGGTAMP